MLQYIYITNYFLHISVSVKLSSGRLLRYLLKTLFFAVLL